VTGRDLSIVVPVFNEVDNIDGLVASLDAVLTDIDWEIIFVDDNSPDGTANAVRALSLVDDRVRLVLRLFDRGLAKSCVQGMLSARADILCVMDGDGQHDPSLISKLIGPLKADEADVVSASRRLDDVPLATSKAPDLFSVQNSAWLPRNVVRVTRPFLNPERTRYLASDGPELLD
jgi:dolichol-phosphate mannosyltransferase